MAVSSSGLGQQDIVLCKSVGDGLIGEDSLNAVLAVIEVALYSANVYVLAFLSGHLALLHLAHAVLRVEHGNAREIGRASCRERV